MKVIECHGQQSDEYVANQKRSGSNSNQTHQTSSWHQQLSAVACSPPNLSSAITSYQKAHNGPILARRRYDSLHLHPTCQFSPPTELINIHSAFHAGAFQQVLDFDTSSFSSSNALPVRVLQLRSKIALGQAKDVASELASEKTPALIAVKLLADLELGKDVLSQTKKLAEQHGQETLTVQLLGGIILERAGEKEEALALLSKHQGSLDACVQLYRLRNLSWSGGAYGAKANIYIAWLSLSKSTCSKIAPTSPSKKPSVHGNGPKTAFSLTLPNHGSACAR